MSKVQFVLPVTDIDAPTNPWMASEYPSAGVYRHSGQIWIVANGVANGYMEFNDKLQPAPAAAALEALADRGVSEVTLLRAIAISQKPELAADLLKGGE